MEYKYDREAMRHAGGAAFSKYGRVRNSKDLRVLDENLEELSQRDREWIRTSGPKTVALESGDDSAWEEEIKEGHTRYTVIPRLRICERLDENSEMYRKEMGKFYDCGLIPWRKGIGRYLIDVYDPKGVKSPYFFLEYKWSRSLAISGNDAERTCNKEKIINILMGKHGEFAWIYLSPWKVEIPYQEGNPWENIFDTYPSDLKSRILEMYREIADMDQMTPRTYLRLYKWIAEKLLLQPYVSDRVTGYRCLRSLAKRYPEEMWGYRRKLDALTWDETEESFLVMKRLESYNIPEVTYGLGIKYVEGLGCEKDYQEAVRYFVKGQGQGPEEDRNKCAMMISYATRKGDSHEIFKIAMKKLESESYEEGIKRLEKLADEDNFEDAQYQLAKLLEIGYKVRRDTSRAFDYYKKAAEAGHIKAIKEMLQIYEGKHPEIKRTASYYRDEIAMWNQRLKNLPNKDYRTR